jgi:hypothetical protein
MLCIPEPIFGGAGCVGSIFHILRSCTHFSRYRGHRVEFSFFALPNSFSAVPRAPTLVFMFCTLGSVFDNTEGANSFSVIPRASGAVFMFCAPRHDLGGIKGTGFYFYFLRSRTCFRQYRQGLIFMFVLPESFSAVSSVSGLAFIFCATGLIFCGTEDVGTRFLILLSRTCSALPRTPGSSFHVLLSRIHFRRF